MDKPTLSLELVPMDGEAVATDAAKAARPPPLARVVPPPTAADVVDAIELTPVERAVPIRTGASNGDSYAGQAAREYAEGKIDQPLWDRAVAQANGDDAAAAAIYVRARTVALRLFDRDRKARAGTPPPRAPDFVDEEDEEWRTRQRLLGKGDRVWSRHRLAIVAASIAVALVGGGAWWALSRSANGGEAQGTVAAAAKAQKAAAAPVLANVQAAPKVLPPDFGKKIQELRDAGNWNVLVLYAVEWTRKEPSNAAAWENLRMGYMYLRQYDDALSAATKAVRLAPDEARLWRQLAEVNVEIDDPAAALAAFEQAAARNSADVDSMQQAGLLNARLGYSQEAKAAFDRASAVNPADAITGCLRTAVAQMPPARDAYTMSRQIRAIDNRCRGRADNVATTGK